MFDAKETGALLVHAVNAQGVWGSGIAAEFKKNFPKSFKKYKEFCDRTKNNCVGTGLIPKVEKGQFVGCLVTSSNYGDKVDTEDQIIAQTYLALNDLFSEIRWTEYPITAIYSNKFNSGLFGVPWEKTEKALQYFVEKYNVKWVVCEL